MSVRIHGFCVEELCMLLWGFSRKTHLEILPLFKKVSEMLLRSKEFSLYSILDFVDACNYANYYPGYSFLDLIGKKFISKIRLCQPCEIARGLLAFASLDYFPDKFYEASIAIIYGSKSNFNAHDIIDVLYAYSISDKLDCNFLRKAVFKLLSESFNEKIQPCFLYKIWFSYICHKSKFGQSLDNLLPKRMLNKLEKYWICLHESKPLNPISEEIEEILKQENLIYTKPFWESQYKIKAEFAIVKRKKHIVILIVNGEDVLEIKSKLLRPYFMCVERIFLRSGYSIIRLEADKWNFLKIDDKKNYITNKINHVCS